MNEQQELDGKWSDQKKWIMGLIGAIIVGLLGWTGAQIAKYFERTEPSIVTLSFPNDGALIETNAETLVLKWNPIPSASRYIVLLETQNPSSGEWSPREKVNRLVTKDLKVDLGLLRSQSIRWKIEAVSSEELLIGESSWRYFTLQKTTNPIIVEALHKNCNSIKTNKPNSKDGQYTIDIDGSEGELESIDVYCDMTTKSGGWTLFANHSDGFESINATNTVTPNRHGVLSADIFSTLVRDMNIGMLFKDEYSRISFINKQKLVDGNCMSVNSVYDLTSPIRSTGGVWHHENNGCGDGGRDYSLIQLQNKTYNNYKIAGAALYQESSAKFDIWPYQGSHSYEQQNSLEYYIK